LHNAVARLAKSHQRASLSHGGTNSFAQKAGVEIDQESIVRLRTANGIVDDKRGRAQTIQLRSLLAKNVPIVVQAGAYGDGIDGLLGMSFMSRFIVAL
jgi:aspartyl protease family protein